MLKARNSVRFDDILDDGIFDDYLDRQGTSGGPSLVDAITETSWRVDPSATDRCEHPVDTREPMVEARAETGA